MGVETILDVEESTEPPICGYKDPTPNVTSQSDSQPCATEEKSILHTKEHPTSTALNQPNREPPDRIAHLTEPTQLALSLQTDLRCVIEKPKGTLLS